MKDFRAILEKRNANILITGDSLAYNRYSYDETPRENAYNCGVGMKSWSFSLRDYILTSDPQFIYGDALTFDCPTVFGIANHCEVPHTAMFQGKIKTLYPQRDVHFEVPVKSSELILYLQHRADSSCTFDVLVDGSVSVTGVQIHGETEYFAGYGLLPLILPCDPSLCSHTVCFTNICGDNPVITVTAASGTYTNVVLNGKGGESVSYFLEHYEERIKKHQPDLILMTLSANDRIKIAPDVLRQHLSMLLDQIFTDFPACKLLFILPPSSEHPEDQQMDISPFTAADTAAIYNRTIRKVCTQNKTYDIEIFDTPTLFENEPIEAWRFDNIHLNRHGNEKLLNALINIFKRG